MRLRRSCRNSPPIHWRTCSSRPTNWPACSISKPGPPEIGLAVGVVDYGNLKTLHILLALLSISGFMLRWWWMSVSSPLATHRLTRILPHLVDTLFLATGIALAWLLRQYPFVHGWLTAKVIGLVVYIVLGTLALKRLDSMRGRRWAFVAALLTYAWIVAVARSKQISGFFTTF
ncbi:MAG: SirB2 family protein [Xanthomonadales bacterium]|nr:SirB2 family protein [Xanthomonadales bacterium]